MTLREVFEELAGGGHPDPAAVLREHGFDLPDAELRYALVSYAHSAPVDVAGHLQPYVMANSPVSWEDTPEVATLADGLGLLTTAPPPDAVPEDPIADLDGVPGIGAVAGGALTPAGAEATADRLDFGTGADAPAGAGPAADAGELQAAEDWPDPAGGLVDAGVDPAGTGGPHPPGGTDVPWDLADTDLFGPDAVGGEPFEGDPAPERPGDEDDGDTDTDLIGP